MNSNWYEKIKSVVPGGIDGNAKVFSGAMPVIVKSKGAHMEDVEGNTYIDYIAGYGPLLFGHSDPRFIQFLNESMQNGSLYGLPHELMYKVGKMIIDAVPSAEMVRYTNTGTEATLTALRLAKGFTGRDKIIKFYGNYHGTHDFVLIGTEITTNPKFPFAKVSSAGITKGVQQDVYTLEFNDSEGFKEFMSQQGEEIAAVIIEPLIGSYGIMAEKEFLEVIRHETSRYGTVLIFDEIITGFRLGLGGAQELFNIIPDLTTLGKVLGGGIPVGAVTGKQEIMERIIPHKFSKIDSDQSVYHSGTFNANPLALSACLWMLTELSKNPNVFKEINAKADRLRTGFKEMMGRHGIAGVTAGKDSVFQWYFGIEQEPKQLSDLLNSNNLLLQKFHQNLVELGVLFIGSPRGFVSFAHSDVDIDKTIEIADVALLKALNELSEKNKIEKLFYQGK
ncbi:aspartate aminotransferase family protein [Lederbergia citrea]|uniref:aspartate aminotransferase family protein n=1 Tax=Lederbergia citrea TaxID=2833581 RepID=UPI001BCA4915|nr:aspartate aminotransferase family protein [Lederbergia citrea]MBS4178801.1 aspartate aminotransferase family protein [Lederbergia citrea]